MSEPLQASGPELSKGIELADIPDGGMLTAQVNGEPVVAVRRGEEVFVLAATCGHYGAPLWDGIVVGTEVRCPWHHARFDAPGADGPAHGQACAVLGAHRRSGRGG
jgi:nitrite reductase/ring-hydroxylating ferredoxin subunit